MTQKRTVWSVIVLAALLLLVQAVPAFADSKPFFVSQNGSVFSGGWFYQGSNYDNCLTTDSSYQAPDYSNLSATRFNGAIMAFANVGGSRVGASSTLDALALGLIEGDGSDHGFFSGRSGQSDLSLSNVNSNSQSAFWGGMLDGSNARRGHCIPDYYNTKRVNLSTQVVSNVDLSRPNGQYQINPGGSGVVSFNGGTVPAGRKLTYFINGDLYITGQISYASHTADNVPKLAFVVRGNIYVNPNVARIDGWYIAQPNGTGDGEFWTCHDGDPSNLQPVDTWVRSNCDRTLRVNGAVTARQVNLLRVNGGLGGAGSITPAEVFDYTPEMVIGGPFFNQPPSPGDGIQSLISLPPVF